MLIGTIFVLSSLIVCCGIVAKMLRDIAMEVKRKALEDKFSKLLRIR